MTNSTIRFETREKPSPFRGTAGCDISLPKIPDSEHKITEGGLRLQGTLKKVRDVKPGYSTPLITVVTVIYNGAGVLESTIKSVIGQNYDNIEYIVVDGGSTDGTLDIIRKYEQYIDYWVSEPDLGIYDAMNKGIELGSGEWINFMNAGDSFFNSNVLQVIFQSALDFTEYKVIYGDHEVRYPKKRRIGKAGQAGNIWKGSQFCHQSAFADLSYHKINKFNLQRKIAADFEFFYTCHKSGLKMLHLPCIVSTVSSGGVSDTRRIDSILEWWLIIDKTVLVNFRYIYYIVRETLMSVFRDSRL